MPVDLTKPLAWTTATGDASTMLSQLQPNILKGHVREHLQVLFVQFSERAAGRAFLGAVAGDMKSARKHLREVERFASAGTPGTVYVGVGITRKGYAKLGIPAARVPGTSKPSAAPFRASMRSDASVLALNDPPVSRWEEPYRHTIHAVVLIGDATSASVTAKRAQIDALCNAKVVLLGTETGRGQSNRSGDGIEHFGYVDGRSQPLFLEEDIAAEPRTPAGWHPAFALGRVLVRDSAAPDPDRHFGSFLVFRKLEQNVRRMQQAERDLADELGLTGADRARAGATIVGRFRDGTPLTTNPAGGVHPVPNDFDYDADRQGRKCPFHGHIRKTNPRGSGGAESRASERRHIMARRGQTYGRRTDDINVELPPSARPTGGVGLLFMAFNAEVKRQFEFTQRIWASNPGFPLASPNGNPGLDQVIGQGARPTTKCPVAWNGPAMKSVSAVPQAVTMKGGEYFFVPSIAFLKSLA